MEGRGVFRCSFRRRLRVFSVLRAGTSFCVLRLVQFVLFIFPAAYSLKQYKVVAKLLSRGVEGRDRQVGASLSNTALYDGKNKSG